MRARCYKALRILPYLPCAALCVAHTNALASQQTGQVQVVYIADNTSPNGLSMSGARTTKPACATDDLWVFTLPQTLSGVLSAYMSGKSISVFGTGTCGTAQPNRESVSYVTVQ
jgi:hypothetical protein